MTAWHRSIKANCLLRALGLIFCGFSYAAVARLCELSGASPGANPDHIWFGLAGVGFLAASAGIALLCLGNHLFDEVDLPARYRRRNYLSGTNERL